MNETPLPRPEPEYVSQDSAPVSFADEKTTGPSKKKLLGGVAALAVVAGVAGAGAYAYNMLSSSGDYPYAHVAPGAIAYVQTNLDPDAEQKLAINKLAKKFPELDEEESDVFEAENINAAILEEAFGEEGKDVDLSWVGSRMAFAMYPDSIDSDTDPEFVVLIEAADVEKAEAALPGLAEAFTEEPAVAAEFLDETSSMTVEPEETDKMSAALYDEKWVGVTEEASVEALLNSKDKLDSDDEFMETFDDADGTVLGAWVSGSKFYDAWRTDMVGSGSDDMPPVTIEGSGSLALEVREDGVDLVSRTNGLLVNGKALGAGGDADAVEDLIEANAYEDASVSFGFGGLGETIADAAEQSNEDLLPDGVTADQVRSGLGDTLAASLAGETLEDLRLRVVLEGVDEDVVNAFLAEDGVTLDDLELQASSQFNKETEVELESGTLTVTVGEAPEGGADFEKGNATGRVALDPLVRLITSFFGGEDEVEDGLGVINFWSNMDEDGDGEGHLSWTTSR